METLKIFKAGNAANTEFEYNNFIKDKIVSHRTILSNGDICLFYVPIDLFGYSRNDTIDLYNVMAKNKIQEIVAAKKDLIEAEQRVAELTKQKADTDTNTPLYDKVVKSMKEAEIQVKMSNETIQKFGVELSSIKDLKDEFIRTGKIS